MSPISWVSTDRCSSCRVTSGWNAPSAISRSAIPTNTCATRRSAFIMVGLDYPQAAAALRNTRGRRGWQWGVRSGFRVVEWFGDDLVLVFVNDIARAPGTNDFDGHAMSVQQCRDLMHLANVLDGRSLVPAERYLLGMRSTRLGEAVGLCQMLAEPLEQSVDPRALLGAGFAGFLQTNQRLEEPLAFGGIVVAAVNDESNVH